MVIKEERPICMAELISLVSDSERSELVKKVIKKFKVLSWEKAEKLGDSLRNLKILKLKEAYIVKIIDFVPKEASELNKILSEVSLDKDEVDKILNVTRNY